MEIIEKHYISDFYDLKDLEKYLTIKIYHMKFLTNTIKEI